VKASDQGIEGILLEMSGKIKEFRRCWCFLPATTLEVSHPPVSGSPVRTPAKIKETGFG
jgi:hypothetical protein